MPLNKIRQWEADMPTQSPEYRRISFKSQRGVATLSTALILLLAITLMTFSAARVGVVEQQIAANDYRARQALHAAEGGLERAVYRSNAVTPVLSTEYADVLPGSTTTTTPCTVAGICYSYIYTSVLAPTSSALLRVTATGYSDDGSARKTVVQYIKKYSLLQRLPSDSVKTAGSYISNSNAIDIINNIKPNTIVAGGSVDTGGKTITSVNGVAGAGIVAGSTTPGITGAVDTAAEQEIFFQSVFGTSSAEVKSASLPINCAGACAALSNTGTTFSGQTITNYGTPQSPSIWVTGNTTINSNMVIGSPTKPVLLVVNGSLTLNGGATIYGFIYVTGNVTDDPTVLAGNADVFGGIISERDLRFGGTAQVTYNDYPTTNGPFGPTFYVKVPGTWIDP